MGIEEETHNLVVERDNYRCVACGKRSVEVHEVIPRSQLPGASNEDTLFAVRNRCCLCRTCHTQVHTVWGRVMLFGLLKLKYGYVYNDEPFAKYFRTRVF